MRRDLAGESSGGPRQRALPRGPPATTPEPSRAPRPQPGRPRPVWLCEESSYGHQALPGTELRSRREHPREAFPGASTSPRRDSPERGRRHAPDCPERSGARGRESPQTTRASAHGIRRARRARQSGRGVRENRPCSHAETNATNARCLVRPHTHRREARELELALVDRRTPAARAR